MFPLINYKKERRRVLFKTVPTAMIYTMNCTKDRMAQFNYETLLSPCAIGLGMVFGSCETLYSCDTLQFADYSLYDVTSFDGAHKARRREEQFPADLRDARDLGARLVRKAAELNM